MRWASSERAGSLVYISSSCAFVSPLSTQVVAVPPLSARVVSSEYNALFVVSPLSTQAISASSQCDEFREVGLSACSSSSTREAVIASLIM